MSRYRSAEQLELFDEALPLEAVLKVATKAQRHKEATKNIKNLREILVSLGLSGENLDF